VFFIIISVPKASVVREKKEEACGVHPFLLQSFFDPFFFVVEVSVSGGVEGGEEEEVGKKS